MGANDIVEKEITEVEKEPAKEGDKIEVSKAEYDKLVADSENYKGSAREAQNLAAFKEVYQDNTKFYKLYDTDKSKAKYVAEQYGFESADALKSHLDTYYKEHPEERTAQSEDDLLNKMEARQEEKEAKKTLNSFFKELGVTKDSKVGKEILDEFNDFMDGKKWTVDNVEKYANKAYNLVKNTGKFAEDLYKTKSALVGAGMGSSVVRRADMDTTSSQSKLAAFRDRKPGSIQDHVNASKK